MDANQFDELSRTLASGVSRRAAIKGIAGGLLGALGLRTAADAQVAQVDCGNQFCASNPAVCNDGCVCCVYTNAVTGQVTNSRCRPPGTCTGTIVSPTTTTTVAPTTTTTTEPTTTAAPVCAQDL